MLKKKILQFSLLALVFFSLAVYFSNKIIVANARGKLYQDAKSIPFNRVGLLLGTSPYRQDGKANPYYSYRIAAATKLLSEKKIRYLVISGDNSRADYNEPACMRADLINAGVDSSIIYLDYAGFRTFDSIVRLKEIFGQDAVTIISQAFHNERAIFIASKQGIAAIGFNAADISYSAGIKTMLRERLARVKVFLDLWFGKKPKFLGEKIKMPV